MMFCLQWKNLLLLKILKVYKSVFFKISMAAESIQKRMQEIQNSEQVADLFGKLVSGRAGYRAVIEKDKPVPKCSSCNKILEGNEKFCPECGNKLT